MKDQIWKNKIAIDCFTDEWQYYISHCGDRYFAGAMRIKNERGVKYLDGALEINKEEYDMILKIDKGGRLGSDVPHLSFRD